jgi:Na+-transporting NADH:ubiquinone oxidoreductase subunit F
MLVRVVPVLSGEEFSFEAGAWMQWRIPAPDGILKRCFSAASSAAERGFMDFIIRRTPAGAGTRWLFEDARVGTEFTIWGGAGNFRLKDEKAPALMIAGGSGLSAIRSLLLTMADQGNTGKPVTLFFGGVNRTNLYLTEELEALRERLPRLTFIPVLSAPEAADQWNGATGLVTEAVDQWCKDGNPAEEAYLCGSPGMLDACLTVLTGNGIAKDRIYFDKFVSPPK